MTTLAPSFLNGSSSFVGNKDFHKSLNEFVGPTGVYLLDFFYSGIQFYLLLSPYLCFISLYILIYMF